MGIRESLLNTITSVADSDFVRIVTSTGASSKATVRNLFKGFESNLSAKSSLTTSDYIRVVGSDNNAYKQSLEDIANAVGTYNTTVQLLTDCNDGIEPSKAYYANGNTANRPSNAWFFIKCEAKTGNMLFQTAYYMNSTSVIVYQRSRDTSGNWGAWVLQPTRAEIDELNSKTPTMMGGSQVTITDTTYGFIDTGIDSKTHVILAAYTLLNANNVCLISNLNGGNYRVQIMSATNQAISKSGTYRIYYWVMPR